MNEAIRRSGGNSPPPSMLLRTTRLLLLAGSIGLLAWLLRDPGEILGALTDAAPAPIAGAFFVSLAALTGAAHLWANLASRLGQHRSRSGVRHLIRSFARSWLTRYLPGSAWSQGARLVHTDRAVLPPGILVLSMIDEFLLIISSAAALALGMLTWAHLGPIPGLVSLSMLFGAAAWLVSRAHRLTRRISRLARTVLPKRRWRVMPAAGSSSQEAHTAGGAWTAYTAGYLLVNLAGGFSFVLVAASIGGAEHARIPLLIGGYNLAAIVGVLAVFAPAGLGVREGVLTAMLAPELTVPVAASAAILLRALTIVSDLVFVGVVELISSWGRRSSASAEKAAGSVRELEERMGHGGRRNHKPRLGTYYRARLFRRLGLHRVTGRVLDLGGLDGYWAASLGPSARPVLIDVSPVPAYEAVTYVRADALRLPLRDSSFDVVFALDLIEHVDDEGQLVAEALRVLRPGGRLILSTPNATVRIHPRILQPWVNRRWGHERVTGFRPDVLRALFQNHTVSGVRILPLGVPALRHSYLLLTLLWRAIHPVGRWLVDLAAQWDSRHVVGEHGYLVAEVTADVGRGDGRRGVPAPHPTVLEPGESE